VELGWRAEDVARLRLLIPLALVVSACGSGSGTRDAATITCESFSRDSTTRATVRNAIYDRLDETGALPPGRTAAAARSYIGVYTATWCSNSRSPARDRPYPAVARALARSPDLWP
jgi:hypothetical protein